MIIKLRLNPDELEALNQTAKQECRKPEQQARYLVLLGLGLRSAQSPQGQRTEPEAITAPLLPETLARVPSGSIAEA